jgi:5S rRNA maturation endonuclease (ribonuclease M5)
LHTTKKHKIGWDGSSIAFPVFDKSGDIVNIRHRRSPNKTKGQKFWNEKGGKASLFNIQTLKDNSESTIICEGEFDAMVAEQFGYSAVSSTAGAGTFKEGWVKEFEEVKTVYICYDTDEAGKDGAKKVAKLFESKARIVELPHKGDKKVDLTDYFAKLKHNREDFDKLLQKAKPLKTKYELVEDVSDEEVHPAVDYKHDRLFYTLTLPVKANDEPKSAAVTISGGHKVGYDTNSLGYVSIDGREIKIKNVSQIPNAYARWSTKDLSRYLKSNKTVTPALPFMEIKEVLNKFVDFRNEKDADIITLWLIGTYCFPVFDAYPYLYFVGVKRSGKTKTLLIIEKLSFNSAMSSDMSSAVLFRIVEAKRATVALDESEQLSDKSRKKDLRLILNSGYKRGAPAYRAKKQKDGGFTLEAFEVYSPKAIANISGMNDVLEDRALTITMVRTNNKKVGNTAVTEKVEDWKYLRSLLYEFALEYASQISDVYHNDPGVNELLNRQNELWSPLLSIAKVVGKDLFDEINKEAKKRAEEASGADLEDFDSSVLLALRELSPEEVETTLTNKQIKSKAHEYLEDDQREYLTSRGIGAALKRFGIKGKKIQGYWRYAIKPDEIQDLVKRYGVDV